MTELLFSKEIEKILDNLDYSRLGESVAIKVHFGEKGCNTYISPELVRKVYDKIISLGKKATLVECNVLYRGSRVNSTSHIAIAREHGFIDMDIDILDGEKGDEFIEVNGCKIGKGLEKYDSMIVLSHFKGHIAAGYGGALKNIGMGLGSRAGKLHMHSKVNPFINEEKCIGCGICVENCNPHAITIENGKAKIDSKKCEGCAMCIAVCPHGAASIPWGSNTSEELQKRISQYAGAVIEKIGKENMIFINVLEKITSECDCMGISQVPMMDDIGILAGYNIVAIDKASLEFAGEKFEEINRINKMKQIEFASDIGLGNGEYDVEWLD